MGRPCSRKVRLPGLVGALAALQAALQRWGGGQHTYKCPTCHYWHLTKQSHTVQNLYTEALATAILRRGWSVGDTDPSEFDEVPGPIRHRAAA